MPHIRIEGEIDTLEKIIMLIKNNYDVTIVATPREEHRGTTAAAATTRKFVVPAPRRGHRDNDDEFVDIRKTEYWKTVTPGSILAGTRLKHGLTQKQLATLAGMSYSSISAFENGKRPLSRRAAVRLANVMDEDPNDFFDFVGDSE